MIYPPIAALAIPVGRRCVFGGTGVFGSGNISGRGTAVALVRSGPPYGDSGGPPLRFRRDWRFRLRKHLRP